MLDTSDIDQTERSNWGHLCQVQDLSEPGPGPFYVHISSM